MTKEEKELTLTYLTKMQEEYIEGEGYERHPLPEYYALEMAIKALEQQPSEDKVIITMDKGTLKYSGKGYVVYNKDWFEKHFATEVEIMTGYDGYKEQQPCDDCVSRAEVLKQIKKWRDCEFVKMTNPYHYLEKRIQSMPPVTPTHGTCKDCKHYFDISKDNNIGNIYKANYCQKHNKNVHREDFYCKDFESRGKQ